MTIVVVGCLGDIKHIINWRYDNMMTALLAALQGG
jgi:hypothetical protein